MKAPTGKLRKDILENGYRGAAYIHNGGVLFGMKCGHNGCHAYHWTAIRDEGVRIVATNYGHHVKEFGNNNAGRVVVHDPRVLLDGVTRLEVYRENHSEAMKARGEFCDTVTLETPRGARHSEDIMPHMSSVYAIQPDGMTFDGCLESIRESGEELTVLEAS